MLVQDRRTFLKTAGMVFAGLSFHGLIKGASSRTKRPNIIYILADDLGYGDLGCYGQKYIKTPNLDRLAAEGMKFTQHYAGSPVCAPSRCTLMTGKDTGHSYIRDNGRPKWRKHDPIHDIYAGQNPIPTEEVTIAELLKQAGYKTAAIGKWGLGYEGSSGDPNKQGFDYFYGYICQVHAHNHYPAFLWRNGEKIPIEGNDGHSLSGKHYAQDLLVEEAKSFIRQNKNHPFFLYLPFIIPHLSLQVPEESLDIYKGKIPETPYKHRGYLKHLYPHAAYAAMITHMDKGIGEIVNLISELGLDENTLIIFSSDNGPVYDRLGGADSDFFQSAGPFRGRKGSLYEGGIRIPMIARWKGKIKPGTTTDHISAFWDVLPTFCEIIGIDPPKGINGISFLPTLLGQYDKQKKHEFLYWEFPSYGGQQAVRLGNWKAIRTGLKKENSDTQIQLYNLKEDIKEEHNVASQYPDIVQKIKKIMLNYRTKSELFPLKEIYEREI